MFTSTTGYPLFIDGWLLWLVRIRSFAFISEFSLQLLSSFTHRLLE